MELEKLWIKFRATRNKLLQETDKFMLPDYPIDTKKRAIYREYRTYLRDCPKLFDDKTINEAKVKTFEEWLTWRKSGVY